MMLLSTSNNGGADVLFATGITKDVLPEITGSANDDEQNQQEQPKQAVAACRAALNTIQKSRGGRVALPSTHPAVQTLAPTDYRRTVLLQRIDNNDNNDNDNNGSQCWMVCSNELLPAFTPQDLEWLGQLANYVSNVQ